MAEVLAASRSRMKVNIAVCGKFHYHNYVRYLDRQGILKQFIYSHKITTNSRSLRVSEDRLVNIWIKEYLTGLHLRLFGERENDWAFPLYVDLWQWLVGKRFSRADIFHVMLHGTAKKLIATTKKDKCIVVGEPVNAHPEIVNTILNEEYELLGINKRLHISALQRRLIEESGMCDHLLVASEVIRRSYVQKGYALKKIHKIPYGVDLSRFPPPAVKERPDSTFRVICVAQISPRKGQVYLLEAWKKLRLHNSELLLIGAISDEMKPVLSNYDGLFRHIDNVPNAELHRHYGSASVFVLPSVEDGFACVVTEAMACGLPVIVTANVGASEIVEHGKDGFIVPIRSSDSIANHLEMLYRDRTACREMGRNALEKARSDLSWEAYAFRLAEFYGSLLL